MTENYYENNNIDQLDALGTNKHALNSMNNRYNQNKSELQKASHSVTPKSHRNKRLVAKSELSEYKDINNVTQNVAN